MKRKRLLVTIVCLALALVSLSVLGACAQPAPTPTPKPTASPTSTPTATPKPTASPTPTPTPKPTATPAIPEYRFVIATSATGSTGYVTSQIMATLISDKTGGKIKISIIPSSGSVDAINRVRSGEVQMTGSGSVPTLWEALKASGDFKALPSLHIYPILPASRSVFQTVMRADAPVEKWSDLVGKTVAGGTPGSLGSTQTLRWLEIAGIKDKVTVVYLAFNASMDALRDNKVVMSQMLTAAPNSNITEFSTRNPIKFLDFPQDMVDQMMKTYYEGAKLFALSKIPKTTYSNMARDAMLATYMQPWSVNDKFPEDAAYWITKIIWENLPELYSKHAALKDMNVETLKELPMDTLPLHPGAMKYFKEAGILK